MFAPAICVAWDDSFQFWEVIASSALAILVMVWTIRASVAASLAATQKTIDASIEAEERARELRQADRNEQARVREMQDARDDALRSEQVKERERHARVTMAQSLAEAAIRVERALPDDEDWTPARDAWRGLGITFQSSLIDGAATIYDYADHLIDVAAVTATKRLHHEDFVRYNYATQFTNRLRTTLVSWAKSGVFPAEELEELESLRSARTERETRDRAVLGELLGLISATDPYARPLQSVTDEADDRDEQNPKPRDDSSG